MFNQNPRSHRHLFPEGCRINPVRTRLASALVLAAVSLGLLLAPAMAQGPASDFTQIDRYVEELRAASNVPGMALAIVRDGEVVYERGYGYANAQGRPLTPTTPMLIGSVSKSFTALAIMQLVEAGKLERDAPISQYLPWFERPEIISIRHLLTHTSGFSTLAGRQDFNRPANDPQAFEKVARRMVNTPLAHPPGKAWNKKLLGTGTIWIGCESLPSWPYSSSITGGFSIRVAGT